MTIEAGQVLVYVNASLWRHDPVRLKVIFTPSDCERLAERNRARFAEQRAA